MSLRHRRTRFILILAMVVSATAGFTTVIGAQPSAPSAQSKTVKPGRLLVFEHAGGALTNVPMGQALVRFKLSAGSWLLTGNVIVVSGGSSLALVVCTLLKNEAIVELPRGERNLVLEAVVRLKHAYVFELRCRLSGPNQPSSVGVNLARVIALRVRGITSIKS